ncbi:protein stum homolog isoform X1 [Phacochoerus africanus]|uniref:Stum, mechanosensory transduction mediator homolog n=1 Tax=Sus scrofa TaxID=9823 RepID=A0A8D0MW18_PIG|nr:protein stum homolog isoform X1 [Phacochoerus africanus]
MHPPEERIQPRSLFPTCQRSAHARFAVCLAGVPARVHLSGDGEVCPCLPIAGQLAPSAFLFYFLPSALIRTFVSAFTVLCGARTDLPDRHVCCVFWLNIAAALIQILTAIVMVGWIMSIFWGMDMVILASYKEQGIPQQL